MNELAKHIEALLLDNDCVIIPHFGGFVTQLVTSSRSDDENLFLPPIRTVAFHLKLQANDGLLVGSFMKTYRVNENEAKRMVNAQVLNMRQLLLDEGYYDLGSLGVLNQNQDGEITFSPCEAGIAYPSFYGLDAFHMQKLTPLAHPSLDITSDAFSKNTKKRQDITIRINRRLLNNIVASVATILLFLAFSTSAGNTDTDKQTANIARQLFIVPSENIGCKTAANFKPSTVEKEITKETPVPTNSIHEKSTANKSNTTLPHQSGSQQVEESGIGQFCVVIVSSTTEEHAKRFIEKLNNKGIEGAKVYQKGKMVRVIFPGYKTEDEAYIKKQEIKKHPELESAWVLELK